MLCLPCVMFCTLFVVLLVFDLGFSNNCFASSLGVSRGTEVPCCSLVYKYYRSCALLLFVHDFVAHVVRVTVRVLVCAVF